MKLLKNVNILTKRISLSLNNKLLESITTKNFTLVFVTYPYLIFDN